MSVSDFDPRYPEIWRDASIKKVRIPQASHNAAVAMRHRLYRCRAEMKREHHAYALQATKVSISIIGTDPEGNEFRFSTIRALPVPPEKLTWSLVLDNTDAVFDEALDAAGYSVPEAPDLG